MPLAAKQLLPGCATILDAADERARAIEADRYRPTGLVPSVSSYATTSQSFVSPGWPTFTFNLGPAGLALIGVQVAGSNSGGSGLGFEIGLSLDGGAAVNAGSGSTIAGGAPGLGAGLFTVPGSPLATHTVAIYVANVPASVTITYSAPFFIAKPF